jgi:hypothetical protein
MTSAKIVELVNKISEMEGINLLEKILDYCETYDEDPQEIGDILQESEEFKDLLYLDCVKHNIIKDTSISIKDELDVW